MQKGRFGFSLWFYPFIALWTVLMGPALASFLILGFVMAVEKDEWTIKQCLHVVMFTIYWNVFDTIMSFLSGIPLLGIAISVINFIVFLLTLIMILVMGLGRLKRGQDISLPGMGIVNRAYGLIQTFVPQEYQSQTYEQPRHQQPDYQPEQEYEYEQPQQQAPAPPPVVPQAKTSYAPPPTSVQGSTNRPAPPPPPPASSNMNRPAPPPPPPPPKQ
jgi:hypothetical protein